MTFLYPRMIRNISYLLVTTSALALGSSAEAVTVEDLRLEEAHSIKDVTARVRRAIDAQKEELSRVTSSLSSAGDDVRSGIEQQEREIKDGIRLIRLAAIGRYQVLTGLTDVGPDQRPRVERTFHEDRAIAHSTLHAELARALSSLPITSDSPAIGADLGRLTAQANRLAAFYKERPYDLSQQHTELFETSRGFYIGVSVLRPYIYVKQEEGDKPWRKVVFLTVPPIRSQEVTEAKALLKEISATLRDDIEERGGPVTLNRDADVWRSDETLPTLSPLTEGFIDQSPLKGLFGQYRADYALSDRPSDIAAAAASDASGGASSAPAIHQVLQEERPTDDAVLVTNIEVTDDHAASQSSSAAAAPVLESAQLPADGSGVVPVFADLPPQQPAESAQQQAPQLTEPPVVASGDAPSQPTGIDQQQEVQAEAAPAASSVDASVQPSADNTSVQ